jgi:hypothetical protein
MPPSSAPNAVPFLTTLPRGQSIIQLVNFLLPIIYRNANPLKPVKRLTIQLTGSRKGLTRKDIVRGSEKIAFTGFLPVVIAYPVFIAVERGAERALKALKSAED